MATCRLLRRLKKNLKRNFKKINVNKETLVLVFLLIEAIQAPTKQNINTLKKTSLELRVTIVIKKAILLKLIPCLRKTTFQKTSNSFDHLHISDKEK